MKCLLAVQLSPPLSLLPSLSVSLFGLSGLAGLGLLMHFTLYDLFANTLFGQTDREWGERREDTVGTFNVSGQLTQKACRLISLNIYEIKAQAAGVLKFDSLLWSPAACVRVCVHGYVTCVCVCVCYVCVIVNIVLRFNAKSHQWLRFLCAVKGYFHYEKQFAAS